MHSGFGNDSLLFPDQQKSWFTTSVFVTHRQSETIIEMFPSEYLTGHNESEKDEQ